MLDELTPRQFDEWIAYQQVEPDKMDRLRLILTTGFLALCRSWGVDLTPEMLDPALESAQGQEVSPAQAEAMVRAAYHC